jgi:hypothetical protein
MLMCITGGGGGGGGGGVLRKVVFSHEATFHMLKIVNRHLLSNLWFLFS